MPLVLLELIAVPPVNVLAPPRIKVPAPPLTMLKPAPEITSLI